MSTITNNSSQTLGVGSDPVVVLKPGESVEVADIDAITANTTAALWIADGVLTVDDEKKPAKTGGKK